MDNESLFFFIFGLSNQFPLLDALMVYITDYLIFVSVILLFSLAKEGGPAERKTLLVSLLSIPIAIILIKTIHIFYFEPRPFITYQFLPLSLEENNASFPSRHATIMAIFAFASTYYKHQWSLFIVILMALVGVSRIYVGVHYPLDIMGGILTGLLSVIIARQVITYLKIRFFL